MNSPPLFKFLDPHGAKLTLGNGTFKHAKPSDFNDTEDLTINGVFPGDIEDVLIELQQNFIGVVIRHLDCEPTCALPMRKKLRCIQKACKLNPQAEQILRQELIEAQEDIFDIDHLKSIAASFIADVNNFMQGYRVLCVTTDVNSRRMWSEYAKGHTGVAVRIQPNISKDSIFKLFRKVTYQDVRPSLFDSPTQYLSDSLYGDKEEVLKRCIDKVIYTKTCKWKHESECRLVVPALPNETPWDTIPYHAEEITELYLGTKMLTTDREEIMAFAKMRNPNIVIYLGDGDSEDEFWVSKA